MCGGKCTVDIPGTSPRLKEKSGNCQYKKVSGGVGQVLTSDMWIQQTEYRWREVLTCIHPSLASNFPSPVLYPVYWQLLYYFSPDEGSQPKMSTFRFPPQMPPYLLSPSRCSLLFAWTTVLLWSPFSSGNKSPTWNRFCFNSHKWVWSAEYVNHFPVYVIQKVYLALMVVHAFPLVPFPSCSWLLPKL